MNLLPFSTFIFPFVIFFLILWLSFKVIFLCLYFTIKYTEDSSDFSLIFS